MQPDYIFVLQCTNCGLKGEIEEYTLRYPCPECKSEMRLSHIKTNVSGDELEARLTDLISKKAQGDSLSALIWALLADSPDTEVRELIEKVSYQHYCLEHGISNHCHGKNSNFEGSSSVLNAVEQFADLKDIYDSTGIPSGDSFGLKQAKKTPSYNDYVLPPNNLFKLPHEIFKEDEDHLQNYAECIQTALNKFDIKGQVTKIIVGPRLTRFEISLAPGVNVKKVTNAQSNIAGALSLEDVRILAPIPGKNTVGIEIPNQFFNIVDFRSAIDSLVWRENDFCIPILLGRDVSGQIKLFDLAKGSNLLIAGTIESGISVCVNSVIMSVLLKFSPIELRLIMIDPQSVDLSVYSSIPHLMMPIINESEKASLALRWCLNEIEHRYRIFARVHVKNLSDFNRRPHDSYSVLDDDGNTIPPELPFLIIFINEFADLMMSDNGIEQEKLISQIARKGRVVGIHLVIATQIPRSDVLTDMIKDFIPARISLKVDSNRTSHAILDVDGAENLLGMGDMLFKSPDSSVLERIQGSMVTDSEIQKVVDFISCQVELNFGSQVVAENVEIKGGVDNDEESSYTPLRPARIERFGNKDDDDYDFANDPEYESPAAKYLQPGDSDLIRKALEIIITEQKASTSFLQRRLGIGYNKSIELMDELEKRGIVSAPLPGGQKRDILILDELS